MDRKITTAKLLLKGILFAIGTDSSAVVDYLSARLALSALKFWGLDRNIQQKRKDVRYRRIGK